MSRADDIPRMRMVGLSRPRNRSFSRLVLRLLIHLEAMSLAPPTYLGAIYARLCGKRLRARLLLAPLLGRTRSAYRLWRLQQNAIAEENYVLTGDEIDATANRIIALVASGDGEDHTLECLAQQGIEARIVDSSCESRCRDLCREEGTWIMPLEAGDTLAPGAGQIYRRSASTAPNGVDILYADDDLGPNSVPHFKPSWNRELFKYHDYLTGAAIVRLTDRNIADLPLCTPGSTLISHALGQTGDDGGVLHIPYILHHRRKRPAPRRPGGFELTASDKARLPTITVIVPTRNHAGLLRECLTGLSRTEYPTRIEILVIDNGSDNQATLDYLDTLESGFARVLRDDRPFNFAALNNRAVAASSGELICFLNNDIEINDPQWLLFLALQAIRDDVGAVGAQLQYPDGRIQHAGVVLGIGGGAAHAHRLLYPNERGYFDRHALPQFVSAVTAACMVMKRDRFLQVGGFDAENFAVSFNDVDLCMKLNEQGWQTLYEPRAVLVHHESVSRGLDRDPVGSTRLGKETEALQKRWNTALTPDERTPDPFHHPALSPFSEQFVLRL